MYAVRLKRFEYLGLCPGDQLDQSDIGVYAVAVLEFSAALFLTKRNIAVVRE
jgi:hypothetical protein